MGLWALGVRLFTDNTVPGWASIVIPLFLISGVQLLSLGIIGEYLAKMFIETKRRPLYFLDQVLIPGREKLTHSDDSATLFPVNDKTRSPATRQNF